MPGCDYIDLREFDEVGQPHVTLAEDVDQAAEVQVGEVSDRPALTPSTVATRTTNITLVAEAENDSGLLSSISVPRDRSFSQTRNVNVGLSLETVLPYLNDEIPNDESTNGHVLQASHTENDPTGGQGRARQANAGTANLEAGKRARIQDTMTISQRCSFEIGDMRDREQVESTLHAPSFHKSASAAHCESVLGCSHYARNCKIRAKCCGLWFGCRLCHDDVELVLGHKIDRFATDMVMCMSCLKEQPVSQKCVECGIEFARYFCEICKFYDNSLDKDIYHCDKCGICRAGKGLEIDFFHCDNCNACVETETRFSHRQRCIPNSLHTNCPVCNVYLFTSTDPTIFMPCGHTMHAHCFDDYTKTHYLCPRCHKEVTDMSSYNEAIDWILESTKMPPEYDNRMCEVTCYQCNLKSITKFHFAYYKCRVEQGGCGSYNTRVLKTYMPGGNVAKEFAGPSTIRVTDSAGFCAPVLAAGSEQTNAPIFQRAGRTAGRRCLTCQASCEENICERCKPEVGPTH